MENTRVPVPFLTLRPFDKLRERLRMPGALNAPEPNEVNREWTQRTSPGPEFVYMMDYKPWNNWWRRRESNPCGRASSEHIAGAGVVRGWAPQSVTGRSRSSLASDFPALVTMDQR